MALGDKSYRLIDGLQIEYVSQGFQTVDGKSVEVWRPGVASVSSGGDSSSGLSGAYDATYSKLLVGTARDKFRDEFATFDTVNNWDVVQTGAGMAITTDGVANGSRYLKIITGNTSTSETILMSKQTFKFPVRLAVAVSLSQRIINQDFFVSLVSVNANGNVETDSSIAASANLNNAANAVAFKWDDTLATTVQTITRGFGISELIGPMTVQSTTVATGITPNFLPTGFYEINIDSEQVYYSSFAVDSMQASWIPLKRSQNLPDPSKNYKIQIRARNLATAPANSVDFRVHFIRLLDTTRLSVDFKNPGRSTDIQSSVPAVITNSPAVTVTAGNVANLDNSYFNDSVTNLGISATFTGTTRDTIIVAASATGAFRYANFSAYALANVAGTLRIECSNDNITWRRITEDITVPADSPVIRSVPVCTRYHRVVYINGAAAQTFFILNSRYGY